MVAANCIDSNALRRFPCDYCAICRIAYSLILEQFSFDKTYFKIAKTSGVVGGLIFILKQRERIGDIILWTPSHMRINLQVYVCFSIVLLKDACASLVNLSASLIMITLNLFDPFSTLAIVADYLMTLLITCLSFLSEFEGVISIWWLLSSWLYYISVLVF